MATTLTQLVNNMNICATSAGFNTFKFGKLSHINFDHNIEYDLLNLEYPSSRILDINNGLQVYNCVITAARPTSKANPTGVSIVDNVHVIMTSLENRIWSFLACVGAGSHCQDIIPRETIQIHREKGTHNDNLVTLTCSFNVEVFIDCIDIDCNSDWPPTTVTPSYNCVSGECIDPGNGTGVYSSIEDCQNSGECRETWNKERGL
jgi:hypothetical protein|tara:strand:- start:6880 stop:7494 length:615 start_codon:yes stop_codon:yes gene_type:complete